MDLVQPNEHERPDFAAYVESHLYRSGMAVEVCAAVMGVGPQIIERWLSGEHRANAANARRFAEAVGVPLVDVLIHAGHFTEADVWEWVRQQRSG